MAPEWANGADCLWIKICEQPTRDGPLSLGIRRIVVNPTLSWKDCILIVRYNLSKWERTWKAQGPVRLHESCSASYEECVLYNCTAPLVICSHCVNLSLTLWNGVPKPKMGRLVGRESHSNEASVMAEMGCWVGMGTLWVARTIWSTILGRRQMWFQNHRCKS